MITNIKSIVNEDVSNKVVILRADLNIPLVNGVVHDQTRLKRLMPTINYLLENQSKLVICSHLGRPKGKFDENFSLKPLVNVLSEITKAKVHFNSSCIGKEVLKQKTRRSQKTTKKPTIIPPYVPSNKTIKKDPNDTDEYDNPFHWDDDYGIF